MDKLVDVTFVTCPKMEGIARRIHDALKPYNSKTGAEIPLLTVNYTKFPSGEYRPKIPMTVRKTDVLFFHAFHPDPNTEFVKMLLSLHALRLGSPKTINLVLPYMGYGRQDRKDEPRVPISAKVIWLCLEACGGKKFDQTITLDMHSEQQQGFAEEAVDNFPGSRIFGKYLREHYVDTLKDMVIVAPDGGSTPRTQRFLSHLKEKTGHELAFGQLRKERPGLGLSPEIKDYVGASLTGKTIILPDDMIDTGGTTINGADYLVQHEGAKEVLIFGTHAVFSAKKDANGIMVTAEEKLAKSGHHVFVTNSIPRDDEYYRAQAHWLTPIPIESVMIKIIPQALSSGGSVSGVEQERE